MSMGSATAARKKKQGFDTKLNLVSLMDIFTILVFFLLLNSGDSQNLENAKFVTLPNSVASSAMHGELMITVTEDNVMVGDVAVADVADILKAPHKNIKGLADALAQYTEKKGELNGYEESNGLAVTIMGGQAVPYALLKSVMATCNLQNFRDISLAVNRVAGNPVIVTSGMVEG